MDVFKFITVLALLLSSVISSSGLSTQTPVDLAESADQTETASAAATAVMDNVTASDTTEALPAVAASSGSFPAVPPSSGTLGSRCSTAHGLPGTCAARQDCQHSTPAVDLTLFATHSYVKPCSMGEVCCPFDALINTGDTESSQPAQDANAFDFDEDD